MATANGFLSFLNGYSIFQGSIVGIMAVDYFLLRRGNLSLSDLFTQSSVGRYYYTKGVHIAGIAAFAIGFLLPLPGFIGSFGTAVNMSAAATDLFDLGWVLSLVMGGLSYWIICRLFRTGRDDRKLTFEEQVPRGDQETRAEDGMEVAIPTEEMDGKNESKSDVRVEHFV